MALTKHEACGLYESELERIERVIRFTCRRNGLSAEEAEEFRGEVHLRLLDDDCAILCALEDPGAMGTYLAIVVQRMLLDFRSARWGRWRPSVAARRAGAVAVRLETLVVRDRLEFSEAFEILRREAEVEVCRDELYALLQTFPRRYGMASQREIALSDLPLAGAGAETPESVLDSVAQAGTECTLAACLERGLASLPAEDRLLLRLVFLDGHPVSRVARMLGLDQKPLYRRLERIHAGLRSTLESEGVGREQLQDLLDRRGVQMLDLREILDRYPSKERNAADSEPPRAQRP